MTPTSVVITASDLSVGRVFELGTYDVTLEEIVTFASHWDPLPIHVDPVAAASGPFGEIVGSGAHMVAIMVRLCALKVTSRSTVIAGRGIGGATFRSPLRPGTVTGQMVIDKIVPRERGDMLVTTRTELRNAQGEIISDLIGETIWT